ncbi:MAG: YggT family protein [Nitrospirota bacterium]
MGNIILGLTEVLSIVVTSYKWIIIIRALLSWVNPDPYNPIVQFLTRITEPVLKPIRKLMPPWKMGGLDLSPLVAILALIFLEYALIGNLREWGQHMKYGMP